MKKNKYFDVVVVISIIFLCLGLACKVMCNDTFYTIKIGELILNNGIDMKDHFSWISNLPYTYPHWLYDVFIYLLYKIDGFNALYLSNIVFYSVISLLTYFISKKRTNNNYILSFILSIFTIGFLMAFITVRAQMVSFIIFILEEYFLSKFLETGNKKEALIIILLSFILVNVHLAVWIFFFVLFLPPIVSHYLTKLINKIRKKDEDLTIGKIVFTTNKNVPKLFIVLIFVLLTGFLTPLGFTPFTYVINQFQGSTLSYIIEYQDATLSNLTAFYQYLLLIIGVFLFTKQKIKLSDLFLFLGLVLMTLMAVRSFAYFVILIPFVISSYLGNIKISKKMRDRLDYIFTRKSELITILVCFVAFGSFFFYYRNINNEYVYKSEYPIDATNYIKENIDTSEMKLFNCYNFGSYLLFNDIEVFIDSRSDLYTTPFNKLDRDIFDDYIKVVDDLEYEEVFEYYGVTHVLLDKDNQVNLIKLLDNDDYNIVYSDDYFILFEKNSK